MSPPYKDNIYPTPGCENQWIWAVVSKGVDTTGPNLHIGYNTLICISVARRACVFMAFMPYLAIDLLLMPKVNCMYRLYDSFNNPLLYWLHNAVCSKYSLDKITKREIIKRLFCHVTHGDMTSQLDITWQRGKTIAKHLFCKRHGSKSYFGSQSKCVICVAWYIHGYRRGIKTKPHLLLHIFHDTSLADPAWKPLPLRGRGFHAGRLVKYHGKYATAMWFCFNIR